MEGFATSTIDTISVPIETKLFVLRHSISLNFNQLVRHTTEEMGQIGEGKDGENFI